MCVRLYVSMYVHTCVCMYVCVYVCMYVCMCVCMCVYMFVLVKASPRVCMENTIRGGANAARCKAKRCICL